jgi:hypothetical protein
MYLYSEVGYDRFYPPNHSGILLTYRHKITFHLPSFCVSVSKVDIKYKCVLRSDRFVNL